MIDTHRWSIDIVKSMFARSAWRNIDKYYSTIDVALDHKIKVTLKNRAKFDPGPGMTSAQQEAADSVLLKLFAFATIAAENAPFACIAEKVNRLNTSPSLIFTPIPTHLQGVSAGTAFNSGTLDSGIFQLEHYDFTPWNRTYSPQISLPVSHPFDKYDYRKDLGNSGYGMGEKYRGRGFFQLTGMANYKFYGEAAGLPRLVFQPDLASVPENAALIVAEYTLRHQNAILRALHRHDLVAAREVVNGKRRDKHGRPLPPHGLDAFSKAYLKGEKSLISGQSSTAPTRPMHAT